MTLASGVCYHNRESVSRLALRIYNMLKLVDMYQESARGIAPALEGLDVLESVRSLAISGVTNAFGGKWGDAGSVFEQALCYFADGIKVIQDDILPLRGRVNDLPWPFRHRMREDVQRLDRYLNRGGMGLGNSVTVRYHLYHLTE